MAAPSELPTHRPSGGPLAAPLLSTLFRMWTFTWRVRRHGWAEVEEALAEGPCVLAFWHGEQVAFIGTHRHIDCAGMASLSPDGELLARVITRLGYALLRGSTSRGGKAAFQAAREAMDRGLSPALAVDGPRGPRHRPHVGAVALAAAGQRPVFWCLSRAGPTWRLGSWDRFEIPLPFARVDLFYGRVEPVADATDRAAVEAGRVELGEQMRSRWALVRGEAPEPLPPEWRGPVVGQPEELSAEAPTRP